MGISYSARLIWGIKFKKPEFDSNIDEDEDEFDEKWEDIGEKWKDEHEQETGISIDFIEFCYDGLERENEASHFMFPTELGFESRSYGCTKIEIPSFNEIEMIEKFKKACKILDIEYQEPGWYLMSEGS